MIVVAMLVTLAMTAPAEARSVDDTLAIASQVATVSAEISLYWKHTTGMHAHGYGSTAACSTYVSGKVVECRLAVKVWRDDRLGWVAYNVRFARGDWSIISSAIRTRPPRFLR
jgi:hypothetical protein